MSESFINEGYLLQTHQSSLGLPFFNELTGKPKIPYSLLVIPIIDICPIPQKSFLFITHWAILAITIDLIKCVELVQPTNYIVEQEVITWRVTNTLMKIKGCYVEPMEGSTALSPDKKRGQTIHYIAEMLS
jgi:hypothetical protein